MSDIDNTSTTAVDDQFKPDPNGADAISDGDGGTKASTPASEDNLDSTQTAD